MAAECARQLNSSPGRAAAIAGLRSAIEARVPHGRTHNGGPGDSGAWDEMPAAHGEGLAPLMARLKPILDNHPQVAEAAERAPLHAGTLGTGNHFIEVCLDEVQRVWLMLHSGSRGIGNRIGSVFIEAAKREMKQWFIDLPDQDLAYLPEGSDLFADYLEAAVDWAQAFARLNRELMMAASLAALAESVAKPFHCDCQAINCHHNYVTRERHFNADVLLTRKGAWWHLRECSASSRAAWAAWAARASSCTARETVRLFAPVPMARAD